MALNSLEEDKQLRKRRWGCTEHLHSAIEAMRLGFSDTLAYCADPNAVNVPLDDLLSKQYAKRRRADHFKADQVQLTSSGRSSQCADDCLLDTIFEKPCISYLFQMYAKQGRSAASSDAGSGFGDPSWGP